VQPKYFRNPGELRRWLQRHHASERELVVGFHKVRSGRASITWAESVDEALCFGWIDGVRRRLDESSYCIRFTPRRAGSVWSTVNTRRARQLERAGRMAAAGLQALEARRENRSGRYSYEQRPAELVPPYSAMLKANPAARRFFAAQIPSYRRAATWWVLSARKEATRTRRAATLVELSAAGRLIPQFLRPQRSAAPAPAARRKARRLRAS
jgi:uncharacterized protein YdeI (YjbR/CyaY-like superfamily)